MVTYPVMTNQFENWSVSLNTFMTVIMRPDEFHSLYKSRVAYCAPHNTLTSEVSATKHQCPTEMYIIEEMGVQEIPQEGIVALGNIAEL